MSDYLALHQEILNILRDVVKENVHQVKVRERAKEETKSLRQFRVDKSVWLEQPGLNTKLSEAWLGPFTLTSHHSNVIYEIGWDQEGKKKERIVHVNNLKPHIYDEEIEEEKSHSSPVLTAEQQQSLDAVLGNIAHVFLHMQEIQLLSLTEYIRLVTNPLYLLPIVCLRI